MEEIKDIVEILELVKEELKNNDENTSAILDLKDLKALKNLYDLYQETEKERDGIYNDYQDLGKENLKLQEELEQEKEKNKELEEHQRQYLDGELITAKQGKFFEKMIKENYIRKDKIKKFIDEELPGEEICKSCDIYDVNGVSLKEKLEKILEV